jgi:hypothetical protein
MGADELIFTTTVVPRDRRSGSGGPTWRARRPAPSKNLLESLWSERFAPLDGLSVGQVTRRRWNDL